MDESTIEASIEAPMGLTEKVPLRVLHVDDDSGFLKVAQQCLKMQGAFEVETATSVEEAKEKLKKHAFDVVVSDYKMPGKDGLEFLGELRGKGNTIPFVMFTGKGREEVAVRALNLGADRYVNKIGDPETVYAELAYGIRQTVERKRAEEQITFWKKFNERTVDSFSDPVLVIDPNDYTIFLANDAILKQLKLRREDLIGKTCYETTHHRSTPCQPPHHNCPIQAMLKTGETTRFEHTHFDKDNNEIYVEVSAIPIKDEKGTIIRAVHTAHDITKRKRTEQALRESEERYRSIVELAPDSIITANTKGVVTSVNTTFTRLTGFSKDEIVGKHFTKVGTIRKRDLPMFLKMFSSLVRGKAPEPFEVIWKHKDGTTHPTEIHVTLVKSDGKTIGFQAITRDITERKKAEKKLKESEEKFRGMVETTSDWIWEVDQNGVYTYASPRVKDILGYEPEEIIGKTPFDLMPKDEAKKVAKIFGENAKKEKPFSGLENWNVHKNGTKMLLETSGIPILDEKRNLTGYRGIDRDITERKKAEEELRKTKNYLSNLLNYANAPIIVWDKEKTITLFNNAFEAFTGHKKESVLGRNIDILFSPLQKEEILQTIEKATKGEKWKSVEIPILCKDKETKIALWSSANITDKEGKIVAAIAQGQDITERRKAEESLKATLKKVRILNEKLGVVGRLTRHDVRNKLSAVTGNVFLAKQKLAGDHDALKYLGEIDPALQQIERIFEFARNYEKLGVEELAYMDVEKSLGEAVSLVSDLHGVRVVNDCHGLTVLADSLLRQLFYNLIHNSLEHGEKGSQIRVYYEETGKDKLKLVYEDDGVGIPKAEKEQIFKEHYGKATGYGLHLIRKMCGVYGWGIHETGKPGRGAEFIISIPRKGESGKVFYLVSQNR